MKKHFAAILLAWALLVRHFFRQRTHSTEPNGDVGGVFEFYTRGGGILRSDVADAIVRYGRRTVHVSDFCRTSRLADSLPTTWRWASESVSVFRS